MRVTQRHRGAAMGVALAITSLLFSAPVALAHGHSDNGEAVGVPDNARITVVGNEFQFSPHAIHVEKGQQVTVVFRNEGALSHNLTIPNLRVHTETVQSGGTDTIEFTAKKAGTYPFFCSVPGHKQAGMTGEVNVGN